MRKLDFLFRVGNWTNSFDLEIDSDDPILLALSQKSVHKVTNNNIIINFMIDLNLLIE